MRGLALLLLAVSWAATAQTPIEARTILVVGDSISAAYGIQRDQGWVALLEARVATLAVPHQVVNASISGDTTGGALARLPRALEVHKPDLVVIEVGGNDALRGYPIDRIEHNLDAMVRLSKDAGAAVLVLGMEIPPNYGARYTQAFHNVYSQVAARAGTPLVPFLLDGVATDATLMQADGIHPTAAAQPRLLENVWPALKPLL
jgi:acyl-CoA thioesterase I